MRRVWTVWGSASALGLLLSGLPAGAGAPSSSDVEGARVAVFGFVRDSRGAAVVGAVVTADFKVQRVKIVGRSDATGAYAIYKLGEDDNGDVAVTCSSDGYRFVREVPRHIEVTAGQPAEVDCVIAPN